MGTLCEHLSVDGVQNFRDLGGYVTEDDKFMVKRGVLFRCEDPSRATASGIRTMETVLKIKYSVDLRDNLESSRAMYHFKHILRVPIPINCCNLFMQGFKVKKLEKEAATNLVQKAASVMLIDYSEQFKLFFDFLVRTVKGTPLMFHCTAGKDRTGLAAALLLLALGVSEQKVIDDFLLTNEYINIPREVKCVVGSCELTPQALEELMLAHEYFITTAFNVVKAKYGSLQKYMVEQLGLTDAKVKKLRQYYLQRKQEEKTVK